MTEYAIRTLKTFKGFLDPAPSEGVDVTAAWLPLANSFVKVLTEAEIPAKVVNPRGDSRQYVLIDPLDRRLDLIVAVAAKDQDSLYRVHMYFPKLGDEFVMLEKNVVYDPGAKKFVSLLGGKESVDVLADALVRVFEGERSQQRLALPAPSKE